MKTPTWTSWIGAGVLMCCFMEYAAPAAPPERGWDSLIEQVSANRYVVNRTILNVELPEPDLRITRVMLHHGEDGEPDGYSFTALSHASLPAQLGLQAGDILHVVNGQEVVSYETVVMAYQGLSSSAWVHLQITRDGAPLTLSYQLQ